MQIYLPLAIIVTLLILMLLLTAGVVYFTVRKTLQIADKKYRARAESVVWQRTRDLESRVKKLEDEIDEQQKIINSFSISLDQWKLQVNRNEKTKLFIEQLESQRISQHREEEFQDFIKKQGRGYEQLHSQALKVAKTSPQGSDVHREAGSIAEVAERAKQHQKQASAMSRAMEILEEEKRRQAENSAMPKDSIPEG